MCSITGQREKLLKVFGQIGLHQLGTISVKSLVSLNSCVCVIYLPPTAKVIRRRSQFIVSSERLDYKSSSLTTRPRRLQLFSGERFRLIEPLVIDFEKHLVIDQFRFSLFFICHHMGSKPTGTVQNGSNYALDKTVWAEHSCNSLLGHFVLSRLAPII